MFTRDLVVAKRRPVVVWIHGGSFSRFVHIISAELEMILYRGSAVEYDPDLLIFLFIENIKGILHQKNFYRPNLIFWIVMGCGIARFGRRGLKITKT